MRPSFRLLWIASLVLLVPKPGAAGGEVFSRGRVNGDTVTDIADAVAALGWLFTGGEEPSCLDAADVNDDGRIDISDPIQLLVHLFQGGPPLPLPSSAERCPGPDPTPDGLDCRAGAVPPAGVPSASACAAFANAPGVRERSRRKLPVNAASSFVVEEGTAFEIVVEAASSRTTRSGFTLGAGDPLRGGDPSALRVTCDRSLGDPAAGGAAAAQNLAPWFFHDLDGWEDPVYLVEHAPLRIAGDGPLAPAPGTYRFTASVVDDACAASAEQSFTLEVLPSRAPEVFAWIAEPAGAPAPHDPGSGNPRLFPGGSGARLLVVEAFPGGRAGGDPGFAPDPETFAASASPPFAGTAVAFERDPGAPARFFLPLEPGRAYPLPGNTELAVAIGTASGESRAARFIIERQVSYANEVQPIWNVHCTGCHERPDPERGLELVAPGTDPGRLRRNIVNVYAAEPEIDSVAPYLVRPYSPAMSYLFRKIEGTHLEPGVGGEGVRMPQDAAVYLDAGTMRVIGSWILQGAPAD